MYNTNLICPNRKAVGKNILTSAPGREENDTNLVWSTEEQITVEGPESSTYKGGFYTCFVAVCLF